MSRQVQWLRIHTSHARSGDSIPGHGTKILHASWCGQKKKKGRKERVGGKRWENTKKKVKEKREFMIIKVGKKQKKNNKNLAKKG